jgi:hypothetical protein
MYLNRLISHFGEAPDSAADPCMANASRLSFATALCIRSIGNSRKSNGLAFVTSFVCLLAGNARSDDVPGRHLPDASAESAGESSEQSPPNLNRLVPILVKVCR